MTETIKLNWSETLRAWLKPQVLTMLFLGFSAGIPILLIFSTLSVWLTEAGVKRATVTFFSWAALGYSFKFIWAPIIDKLPLPFLSKKLGRRRSWLLLTQLSIIVSILWMASINPAANTHNLTMMALAAVLLGFSSASQDIIIDAYRIECADENMQALVSSTYIAGYRIGMLVAGAGALYIASTLGTTKIAYNYNAWQTTYYAMAAIMLIGVVTTLLIAEPKTTKDSYSYSPIHYLRFVSLFLITTTVFALTFFQSNELISSIKIEFINTFPTHKKLIGFMLQSLRLSIALFLAFMTSRILVTIGIVDKQMVNDTYIAPIKNFFSRYGLKTALILLLLVGFYRVSDIVLGVISNVFYIDLGFSKNVIAGITKTFGMIATIAGGFLGGMLTIRYGVLSILFLGGLLSAATNLLFLLLTHTGADLTFLTIVIATDNFSAGLASTAFVAFLSSLTHISFTAVQYAIFSSLMTLFPKLIGGYSGTLVTSFGYENFFIMTTVMGIPVLFLIWTAKSLLEKGK